MPPTDLARTDRIRVVVAVTTARRNRQLASCLHSLAAMTPAESLDWTLLVVDNDPDGSARGTAGEAGADAVVPLVYEHEPRVGVVHARNTALRSAGKLGAAAVAFCDDDQVVEPGWLSQLVGVWQATGAAAVAGPVLPELPEACGRRLKQSGVFDRKRWPTGTTVRFAGAGNLLLDLSSCRGLEFSMDFNDGGEDTDYTHRLASRGDRIVWADEAVAYEPVEESRCRWRWVSARSIKAGRILTRTRMMQARSPTLSRALSVVRGVAQSMAGILQLVAALLLKRQWGDGFRRVLRGCGVVAEALRPRI